ncbi:MAG: T3SS (YopN, CesT) and YbjN peptide-binding chaperone 1 [Acidimicrobiia bacterium]
MADPAPSPRRAFLEHQVGLLEPFGFVALSAPLAGESAGAALVEISRSEDGAAFQLIAAAVPGVEGGTPNTSLTSVGFSVEEGRARKDTATPTEASEAAEQALTALGADPHGPIDLQHGSHRAQVERERLRQSILERVRGVLASVIDMATVEVDDDGDFTFPYESTRVFVGVRALHSGPLVIRVFAITNMNVEPSPGLGLFLATTNFTLAFGRFSLDAHNNAVWFEHNLPGEAFADEELALIVRMVAQTANEFDGRIQEMFGGELFNPPGEPGPAAAPKEAPGAAGYL